VDRRRRWRDDFGNFTAPGRELKRSGRARLGLSRFSPLFETDLCGLAVLFGRRGRRPQNKTVGLCPHMSPPDTDEGSNCNDNKRQGYRNPHSKFSLSDLGSFGGAESVRRGPEICVDLHPALPPRTLRTIGGGSLSHHPTLEFSVNVRGTSMTLLCYPRRAQVPAWNGFATMDIHRPWPCTPSDARE
jgi:hypothetical protein